MLILPFTSPKLFINSSEAITSIIGDSVVFNCSQTKFAAIILVLLVFYAIFRLTDFSSDAFDFSSLKTG